MAPRDRALAALCSSIFVLVLGYKLVAIDQFGTSIPFYDEWDAEAWGLYKPFVEGTLSWQDWIRPHNEHHLVVMRAWHLLWFVLNGGWDPQLLLVVNAAIHSALAAFLVWTLGGTTGNPCATSVLVVACYAPPYSWLSVLVAFQSQFYFLLVFAALAIWLWCRRQRAWAYAFAAAAWLSVSSGMLVFGSFIALDVWDTIRQQSVSQKRLLRVTATAAWFILWWLFLRVDARGDFGALDAESFFIALGRNLSFPVDSRWAGLCLHLPMVALAVSALRRRIPGARFVLGLGCFVFWSAVAMAYLRGTAGAAPGVRHWDVLLLGVTANGAAALLLLRRRHRLFTGTLLTAWIAVAAPGCWSVTRLSIEHGLPERLEQSRTAEHLINAYLSTQSSSVLAGKGGPWLSYPAEGHLMGLLSDAGIRRILPTPLSNPNNVDRLDQFKGGMLRSAWFATGVGLVGLLTSWAWLLLRALRRNVTAPSRKGERD